MPTIELSDQQVVDLVKQLPAPKQEEVMKSLLIQQWPEWESLSRLGEERIRIVATQRGRNWDTMTEDEREAFVDDLVHEDRPCKK